MSGSSRALGLFAVALAPLASCQVPRPSGLPRDPAWLLAVKSCRCPDGEPTITHFAHHTWFDAKLGDDAHWVRIEVEDDSSGVTEVPIDASFAYADIRWGDREVRVLDLLAGAEARDRIEAVRAAARELSPFYARHYAAWPGPNSNTFVADVARRVDGVAFPLHHNAVGKDHARWLHAGPTTSKTGLRLDTLPLGLAVGLREGVELHILQLTFGVSLWPPRLELPFLPELPWASDATPSLKPPLPLGREITLYGRKRNAETLSHGNAKSADTITLHVHDSDHWVQIAYAPATPPAAEGLYNVRARHFVGVLHDETTEVATVAGVTPLWSGSVAGHPVELRLILQPSGERDLCVDLPATR